MMCFKLLDQLIDSILGTYGGDKDSYGTKICLYLPTEQYNLFQEEIKGAGLKDNISDFKYANYLFSINEMK